MASQQLSESAVIRSLRRFRDTYFPNSGKVVKEVSSPDEEKLADAERCQPGYFDSLPVRMSRLQFWRCLTCRLFLNPVNSAVEIPPFKERREGKKAHASHTYGCLFFLITKITFFFFGVKVDVQFLIMTFMSPADICRLGATSRYWRAMVRDPLLWRYFLLRDMPQWPSIDHVTMPQLDAPVINYDQSQDDSEDGDDKGMGSKFDYMSE